MTDKPTIDIQRLDHLEAIKTAAHGATLRAFEVYRERLQDRGDARSQLAEIDRQIAEQPHTRAKDANWQERRQKAAAKLAEAERRATEAERARDEANERWNASAALFERCTEWCRENKIEVSA